jgi:hypothetical protein
MQTFLQSLAVFFSLQVENKPHGGSALLVFYSWSWPGHEHNQLSFKWYLGLVLDYR